MAPVYTVMLQIHFLLGFPINTLMKKFLCALPNHSPKALHEIIAGLKELENNMPLSVLYISLLFFNELFSRGTDFARTLGALSYTSAAMIALSSIIISFLNVHIAAMWSLILNITVYPNASHECFPMYAYVIAILSQLWKSVEYVKLMC